MIAGGEPVAEKVLHDQLEWVVEFVDESAADLEPEVGVATSWRRDSWAALRSNLLKTDVNAESLHKIENCLFILCIDEADDAVNAAVTAATAAASSSNAAAAASTATAATAAANSSNAAANMAYSTTAADKIAAATLQREVDGARIGQMLHGGGSKRNGCNRW